MNIIIIGMKGVGKTTIGRALAEICNMQFIDLDQLISEKHQKLTGEKLSCREIYTKEGRNYFEVLESESLLSIQATSTVVSTGGGTPLDQENQNTLKSLGTIVYLDEVFDTLAERILEKGVPAYIKDKKNPCEELRNQYERRTLIYKQIADHTIICNERSPNEVVNDIIKALDL